MEIEKIMAHKIIGQNLIKSLLTPEGVEFGVRWCLCGSTPSWVCNYKFNYLKEMNDKSYQRLIINILGTKPISYNPDLAKVLGNLSG